MGIAGESNVANARTVFETLVDGANQSEKSQGAWEFLAREYEPLQDGEEGETLNIPVIGATPAWEQWRGTKNRRGFRKLSQDLPFDRYHKSMSLKRSSVVYDRNGTTDVALQTHVNDVGYVRDKVVFDLLATNPTCADGSAMLANTHTFVNYDNLTADDLSFASYDAGRAAMRKQPDETGEFLAIIPRVLIVNPDEERIALEITGADNTPISVGTGGPVTVNGGGIGATSITNVFRGQIADVVVTPRIASGDWLLVDPRFLPIALKVWREPEAVIDDDMASKDRKDNDLFTYDIEADINAVAVQWEGVYGKLS